jgi:acyl dehydratase
MRCFEDFAVGEIADIGPLAVSADDIKAFAAEFDPQAMHLDDGATESADPGAAMPRTTIVDGLFASGLHIACLHMRLLVDGVLANAAGMGSPGAEEVRYLAPVRPGDALSARFEVLEMRPSKSRPDMGIVKFRSHMLNQHGTAVLRMTATLLLGRRAAASI